MTKGYLLPPDPIADEEIACALVFYPDRDEYRRALIGSLSYLSTWLAWERDENKNGKIAAAAWKTALDLTLECWQMSCLDGLIADVAAIRQMMGLLAYCCDGTITYDPPTVVDPPFVPGVGDPPDNYGETPIADWDEWTEYACYNADSYVDYLIQQATSFASVSQTGAWTLGLVAGALALLSFTGIGLPVSFALASTVLFGLLQATSGTFDSVADDLEDARDDIRCAIMLGEDLESAVGDAIGTGSAAWNLLYRYVDYGSASSIIQSGGYGDEYLPAQTSTDCNCDPTADVHAVFTFDTDAQSWAITGNASWNDLCDALVFAHGVPDGGLTCQVSDINLVATNPIVNLQTYRFKYVSFDWSLNSSAGAGWDVRLWQDGGSVLVASFNSQTSPVGCPSAHVDIDVSGLSDFTVNGDNNIMIFNEPGGTSSIRIDNVTIGLDVV